MRGQSEGASERNAGLGPGIGGIDAGNVLRTSRARHERGYFRSRAFMDLSSPSTKHQPQGLARPRMARSRKVQAPRTWSNMPKRARSTCIRPSTSSSRCLSSNFGSSSSRPACLPTGCAAGPGHAKIRGPRCWTVQSLSHMWPKTAQLSQSKGACSSSSWFRCAQVTQRQADWSRVMLPVIAEEHCAGQRQKSGTRRVVDSDGV